MSSSNKSLTNKLVVSLMFTNNLGEEYVCLTCSKPCKSAHGFINVITHLRINHPTYLEDAGRAAKDRNSLRLPVIDKATRNIFRWCEWVVMNRLPLCSVERKMTRKNASLTPIAKNTLKRYLMRIFESVEARVAEELPSTFGIVLDGYTLSRYNKPREAVHFMIADNCSVNQYIGSREGGLPW
ncbi:hypothetical protein F443_03842 [Phytophthora nicotianae P1569]|uniref:BED-type domain-containing protein n=1 Tax=Phytophthora nicotianae P1569 TaxID=1317065 RepID=V9FNX4_PHYNI|nr:hypothetical protein F443_03842 [Phytophthora nicotianae P1569]